METDIADVTIHIDETLSRERTDQLCDRVRELAGVTGVRCAEERPHLLVVEYEPGLVDSHRLLRRVTTQGVHAQLIGL